jgi:hypothetical protein
MPCQPAPPISASRVPSMAIATGLVSASVWIHFGSSVSGKNAPEARPSVLMTNATMPAPRRNVTITAAATRPRPHTKGTKHTSSTRLGAMPLGWKSSPNVSATTSSSTVMRTGMNSRSNPAEPACTVVGDVGVTSRASSVPMSCSWRIAVETFCSSIPLTVAMTTPIITNSK